MRGIALAFLFTSGCSSWNPVATRWRPDRAVKWNYLDIRYGRFSRNMSSLGRRMVNDSTNSSIQRGGERSANRKGIMYMVVSSFSFSLMFLGVKLSSAPTFTLVFYRSIVQAILSASLLRGQNPLGKKGVRRLLWLRSTAGSLAVAAFFFAIQQLPLPDAISLQFTTPVFAALLAVPILSESWNLSDVIGAIVCLGGVFLIARPSWLFGSSVGTHAALPTMVGLLGSLLVAYVLVRRIGHRADANLMVLYYAVISALSAPFGSKLLAGCGWNVWGRPKSQELLGFVGLGFFGFFGQLFQNAGLNICDSAAQATLVTNIQIVFAFLFEITVLHESISPWSVAGTTLIVGYMLSMGLLALFVEQDST